MNKNFLSFPLKENTRLHFVGIGGVSMSSLALLAKKSGCRVSGSDKGENDLVRFCRSEGIEVQLGHEPKACLDADAVIYTAAVSQKLPELAAAKRAGIPLIGRAEFLGALMTEYKTRIGICGTHGKTTTTAMTGKILEDAGIDPTVAGGAVLPGCRSALRAGKRDALVYEACEYKRSFLSFSPTISVITNIELDHTDCYSSIEEIKEAFTQAVLCANTVIVNRDDKNALETAENAQRRSGSRLISFSLSGCGSGAEFYAEELTFRSGKARFYACRNGKRLSYIELPVIGRFNAYNAMAAFCTAVTAGVDADGAAKSLASFSPAARRFETVLDRDGILIADDYAHHPSEISSTIGAAKALHGRRVICVFQPHTYSRTRDLFNDFAAALSTADICVLADIYAAREEPIPGVSSAKLAESIESSVFFDSFEKIVDYLSDTVQKNDIVITMGAGDIYKVAHMLKERLTSGEKGKAQDSRDNTEGQ